jgi:hypothetical protein
LTASTNAENDFDAMASADVRTERWSVKGTEYKKLVDAVDEYEKLLLARQTLVETWMEFTALVAEREKKQDGLGDLLGDSDVLKDIGEQLSGDVIASAEDLTARKKSVDGLVASVGSMVDLASALTTVGVRAKKDANMKRLVELWEWLVSIITSATELEALRKEARTLLDAVLAEDKPAAPATQPTPATRTPPVHVNPIQISTVPMPDADEMLTILDFGRHKAAAMGDVSDAIRAWIESPDADAEGLGGFSVNLVEEPGAAAKTVLGFGSVRAFAEPEAFRAFRNLGEAPSITEQVGSVAAEGDGRDLGSPAVTVELAAARQPPESVELFGIVETPEEARRTQFRTNLLFATLVGAIAVVSGLAANYVGKDAFGSPGDYLGLLTWGTAGTALGQFLKSVPAITPFLPKR